jgi:hypothetical protein
MSRNPDFPVGCSKCPCWANKILGVGDKLPMRASAIAHRLFVCLIEFRSHQETLAGSDQATSAGIDTGLLRSNAQMGNRSTFPCWRKPICASRGLVQTFRSLFATTCWPEHPAVEGTRGIRSTSRGRSKRGQAISALALLVGRLSLIVGHPRGAC